MGGGGLFLEPMIQRLSREATGRDVQTSLGLLTNLSVISVHVCGLVEAQ